MVPSTLLPATTGAFTLESMSALRTTIAGIPIPDSTLASDATQFVQDVSTQLLFDHSRRVFLWASLQGEKLGLDYDPLSFRDLIKELGHGVFLGPGAASRFSRHRRDHRWSLLHLPCLHPRGPARPATP